MRLLPVLAKENWAKWKSDGQRSHRLISSEHRADKGVDEEKSKALLDFT
jgi:hypothetical protein